MIQDGLDLFQRLPLHAGGLTRALDQYGALRVDEEVVGRLEAPEALSLDRATLSGDCASATHLVVAIELGGASLVAGPTPTVAGERNWFLRPSRSKSNPAPLQYLGRVSTCRRARKKGQRTPGCDHPLRVRLLPIAEPKEVVERRPPRTAPEPEMIAIPAGTFRMGNAREKRGDGPEHEVQLSAFEIDRTEVTAKAYASCVAAGACDEPAKKRFCTGGVPGLELHPINCVSWKQAAAYCAFVKKRLPTEAEWERAARGTDGRRFVWGDVWPPPAGSGNFADATMRKDEPQWLSIDGFDDGHAYTAPVGALRGSRSSEGAADWPATSWSG